jgi:hypothetical protein
MTFFHKILFALFVAVLPFACASVASAQASPAATPPPAAPPPAPAHDYKLHIVTMPPPPELAAPVRDSLSPSTLHISEVNDPYCDIWLRSSVPVADQIDKSAGIVFAEIPQGTLLGAIKFTPAATDYHNQQVQPGVYTLRYLLIPVDGNHQGKAPNRDFVVLVPAVLDLTPALMAPQDLLELSRKASSTGHPSVWSLVPPASNPPRNLPVLAHSEQGDLWVVYFAAPFTAAAAMGLVVAGHAP